MTDFAPFHTPSGSDPGSTEPPGQRPDGHGSAGHGSGGPRPGREPVPYWFLAIAGVTMFAILALLVALVLQDDPEQVQTTDSTTTSLPAVPLPSSTVTEPDTSVSTTEPASSSETTETTSTDTTGSTSTATSTTEPTTTSTPPTTAPAAPAQPETAVWPWAATSTRFDDPVDAARSFITDFVGMTDPILGPFLQGDGRSGEVEVRAFENGPITTVFVRRLGPDDSWWVLGSVSANIDIEQPGALDRLGASVEVTGRASAFEGTVDVAIRADGSAEPIVTGFVTGGALERGPFQETFEIPDVDVAGGALMLWTENMEDGGVSEASVLRIGFESR